MYVLLLETAPEPAFSLPVLDLATVSGVQVFHDNRSTGQVHNGFDFKLEVPTTIVAPAGGLVTAISKHRMSNGYWIIDVNVQVNVRWSYFLAFEPWTTDEAVIDAQLRNITVSPWQLVAANDTIGVLVPVTGSEFPHVHWNVLETTLNPFADRNRSPYDHCTAPARALLWDLCMSFGKFPAD